MLSACDHCMSEPEGSVEKGEVGLCSYLSPQKVYVHCAGNHLSGEKQGNRIRKTQKMK